ncbi:hypothetical protein MBM_00003 [Drepanopeziza brunnea f. sp. 'multigermtubi' MB_m1]|uniref:Uncharacterized protein n=1 Tax=Marssonina brunnea f. sp. multigermtubi (strain MB_m1) TaxID=1072389 RepID=K1WTA2_MARBU|nr:uncharacterized protein MBM_00003 [Drepanopeziza brunnea f. sp. 'multigermtubi' MB_m1]EKD20890.1 hypothetical protein MBM_00003 [Drepanopeziza brunnea f. sp. 'multigermtubi' MB_m1]
MANFTWPALLLAMGDPAIPFLRLAEWKNEIDLIFKKHLVDLGVTRMDKHPNKDKVEAGVQACLKEIPEFAELSRSRQKKVMIQLRMFATMKARAKKTKRQEVQEESLGDSQEEGSREGSDEEEDGKVRKDAGGKRGPDLGEDQDSSKKPRVVLAVVEEDARSLLDRPVPSPPDSSLRSTTAQVIPPRSKPSSQDGFSQAPIASTKPSSIAETPHVDLADIVARPSEVSFQGADKGAHALNGPPNTTLPLLHSTNPLSLMMFKQTLKTGSSTAGPARKASVPKPSLPASEMLPAATDPTARPPLGSKSTNMSLNTVKDLQWAQRMKVAKKKD